MMKAIVKQSRNPEDLAVVDMPIPDINENEMLVKMKAIGVGIHDGYFHASDVTYPYTIGIEGAGIIEKTGDNVAEYGLGDRIAFVSMMQPKGGTWAEYAVLDKNSLIFAIPEQMDFTEAAAIPVAGNTVIKALSSFNMERGGTLFIAGASGAIGTFAIQLAKSRGYQVAASASSKNHEYMRSLGADKTVDYRDEDWIEQVRAWALGEGVDAALAIQPNTAYDSMQTVKNGGKVVTVSGERVAGERGIEVEQVSHQVDIKQSLNNMVHDIANKEMQLTIEHVYPFEDGIKALQKTVTRHAQGKAVIKVD
ncbi:NADP-dependent oxidoreductase [Lentibacillus sp. JNUCC-1]|uniref:NADP-dependent oxidoreductase n=1 Tax=Lentibacillus sp. JNUCC-1 TaxID=2654513 RepID=UPI0018D25210|nr:NADP-dependent oxidoreductase [Lentibacillus sp. JNUCC-1]